MPSSSRSTITASGIATTICSAISSVRSSSGATRSCSPCTSDGQQVGASGTDRLARRSPTRMRPAISLTPAASRLRHRDEFASRGQIESLRLWLDRCTDTEIESDAQLSIAAAWVFGYLGEAARARRFLAAAERAPLDLASADGASSLRSALANLRSSMAPDGISQMLRDAELGYACEKKMGTRWVLSARRAMGAAYLLLGRPQEAIAVLRESLALSTDRPELSHTRVFTLGYLVFAAAELGERRDAQRWAVEAGWLVSPATPPRHDLRRHRLHGRSARAQPTR